MNICFLNGKIVSEIKFEFIYNSKKNISLTKFKVLTKNADNIKTKFQNVNLVFAYNELADKIYSEYKNGSFISIIGCIKNNKIKVKKII